MAAALPVFVCQEAAASAGTLRLPAFVPQEAGATGGVVRLPAFAPQEAGATGGVIRLPVFRLTDYGVGSYSQDGVLLARGGADSYIEFVPLEVTSSAAAKVSSDAIVSSISQETSSAAAKAGAASLLVFDTPAVFMEDMLGGAKLGAAAAIFFEGTVLLGAKAGAAATVEFVAPVSYSIVPEKGIEWGGAAVVQEYTVHVPVGGFVFGGGAQIQEILPFVPAGGVVYSGTATHVSVLAFTPTGGVVYAGSAPNTSVLNFVPSGGLIWTATAPVNTYTAWHAPTGGYTFGGAASVVTATAAYGPTTENPANAPYYGWTINAENAAVSRYLRMPANSMCQMNGKTYVANAGGIYEYGADDDAGQDIRASVQWPKTDFQDGRTKRMEVARFGVKTAGRMRLKAMANEDTPHYYLLMPASDKMKGTRVPIGKGMAGRYWSMRLDNVAGCDFELDSAEFLPVPSRQRHGA